jgi:hypothetical protein
MRLWPHKTSDQYPLKVEIIRDNYTDLELLVEYNYIFRERYFNYGPLKSKCKAQNLTTESAQE